MKCAQVFLTLAVSFAADHYPDSCQVGWCVSDVRSIIVDVRDASEREADGSVSCSGNVPFNAPAGDSRSFAERFRAVYGDGTGYDQVFLYCRSGNRAGVAQQQLASAYQWGQAGILNLGGWTTNNEWRECGECPADKGFPDPYAQCEDGEQGMRAITSGTGTRCASIFQRDSSGSFLYLQSGVNTEQGCQDACLASDSCNYITFYPSNKKCYHTPTCEVVNCAANIWKKDSVCPPAEQSRNSDDHLEAPTGTVYDIDYGFQYAEGSSITVKVGDTVRWTWAANEEHNVRWEKEEFNDKYFCEESPCSITFEEEDIGKWFYYCSIEGHREAGQNGYKVRVREASWNAPGEASETQPASAEDEDPCAGNPFRGMTAKQAQKQQVYKKAKNALKKRNKWQKKAAQDPSQAKKWNKKIKKKIKNPTVKEAEETMAQFKFAKNKCQG